MAMLMVQAPTRLPATLLPPPTRLPATELDVVVPPPERGVEGAETKLLHRIRGIFGEVMDPVR